MATDRNKAIDEAQIRQLIDNWAKAVDCQAVDAGEMLAEHPSGSRPRTHALLALMLLNGARLRSRTDADGNILRLKEQDRSCWDQAMIARGLFHLMQSTAGDEVSEYHLQAGIAAFHCAAKDYESTDWPRILSLYDRLIEMDDSPVVALNRAVAVANVHGSKAGIKAVEAIQNREQLNSYYLAVCGAGRVRGEFEPSTGCHQLFSQIAGTRHDPVGADVPIQKTPGTGRFQGVRWPHATPYIIDEHRQIDWRSLGLELFLLRISSATGESSCMVIS